MTDYIQEYASYLATEKNSSENTITSYVRDVHQFVNYLAETGRIGPEKCGADRIEDYIELGKGLS